MRFGWQVQPRSARAETAQAEALGYDMVWIDGRGGVSPTVIAASLAVDATGIRVGVTESVGIDHPIELAEEVAVADLALGGRLSLAVRPIDGTVEHLPEVLDLLLDCLASHPFRHAGPQWPAPANLEQNVFNLEERIRVAPAPAQIELPVWVAGQPGRHFAAERGLGFVADADETLDDLATAWNDVAVAHPTLVRRIRRSAVWSPPMDGDRVDVGESVGQLQALQRSIGLDLVIIDADNDTGTKQRGRLMAEVSRFVRPRVQLDALPPGLDEHWQSHETADRLRLSNNQQSQPHSDPSGGNHG
jgi:hypothetical protein